MDRYTDQERQQIIEGYLKLDGLTDLLGEASRCRRCHERHADHPDLPLNALVRPLRCPVPRISPSSVPRNAPGPGRGMTA